MLECTAKHCNSVSNMTTMNIILPARIRMNNAKS